MIHQRKKWPAKQASQSAVNLSALSSGRNSKLGVKPNYVGPTPQTSRYSKANVNTTRSSMTTLRLGPPPQLPYSCRPKSAERKTPSAAAVKQTNFTKRATPRTLVNSSSTSTSYKVAANLTGAKKQLQTRKSEAAVPTV